VGTPSLLRDTEPATNEASVVLTETERAATEIRMLLSPLNLSMETPEPFRETEIVINEASIILLHMRTAVKETKSPF
jgi:hypothetical protein